MTPSVMASPAPFPAQAQTWERPWARLVAWDESLCSPSPWFLSVRQAGKHPHQVQGLHPEHCVPSQGKKGPPSAWRESAGS